MTNNKKTNTTNSIILFLADTKKEVRYTTAEFKPKNTLLVKFMHYFKIDDTEVYFEYSFDKHNTEKLVEIINKKNSNFFENLKKKFNSYNACEELIEFADKNNIQYKLNEYDEHTYNFNGVEAEGYALYYENGEFAVPSLLKTPKNGILKLYTWDKKLYMEISYFNNKKNGFVRKYDIEENTIRWEKNYINDKMDGVFKEYDSNGNIGYECPYSNGKEHGIAKLYIHNKLINETSYLNGLKEGLCKHYYPSGELELIYTNKKGELHGDYISYYKNGEIHTSSHFKNGKQHGKSVEYHKNGKIKELVLFKHDKITNKTSYYENGKIETEYSYKNGKRSGITKSFFKNGKIDEMTVFKNGKLNGKSQKFYNNGKLKSECCFKNGIRDGYTTYYRSNGEILFKVLYKNGELIDCAQYLGINGLEDLKTNNSNKHKENNNKDNEPKFSNKTKYNFDLINADTDIKDLTKRIKKTKKLNFSLLLYGEPGSGKSEYAKQLAKELGLPVIIKRASDIINSYVGETEKNIASAFKEAEEDGAVFILDEADTFLSSRTMAHRKWEISEVNEMLTWMENNQYPFICTTNFMDSLDEASLRRFTFKIKFNYMTPEQVKTGFKHFFGLDVSNDTASIKCLTAGDFATVKKKAEFLGIKDVKGLKPMLEDEVKVKKSKELSTKIGFN